MRIVFLLLATLVAGTCCAQEKETIAIPAGNNSNSSASLTDRSSLAEINNMFKNMQNHIELNFGGLIKDSKYNIGTINSKIREYNLRIAQLNRESKRIEVVAIRLQWKPESTAQYFTSLKQLSNSIDDVKQAMNEQAVLYYRLKLADVKVKNIKNDKQAMLLDLQKQKDRLISEVFSARQEERAAILKTISEKLTSFMQNALFAINSKYRKEG